MTDVPRDVQATWDRAEKWMATLGVTFVNVWLYLPREHRWRLDAQVDDHETFLECVDEALKRERANYACWSDGEKWCLLNRRTGDTKRYPNREAAEMVAMHNA